MARITDYDSLVDALNTQGGFTHRNDLGGQIDTFIQMCETTINYGDGDQIDGLRTGEQETLTTLTCVPGTQTVTLPTDLLEIRRVYITVSGIRRELIGRPITPISTVEAAQVNSIPETFFVTNGKLYLVPIPYQNFQITLLYYKAVGPLTSTNTTNWLLTAAPMVYLAGTIVHGALWFGPTFNATPWIAAFRAGMQQVASADSNRFSQIKLRSEAALMVGGSAGYSYSQFLGGA